MQGLNRPLRVAFALAIVAAISLSAYLALQGDRDQSSFELHGPVASVRLSPRPGDEVGAPATDQAPVMAAGPAGSVPVSLEWNRLTSNSSLRAVLEAALVTPNGEDAAVAVHLSALCIGLELARPPERIEEIAAKRGPAVEPSTLKEVRMAHGKIAVFCREGDLSAYVDRIKARNVQVGPLLKQMLRTGVRQSGQEYYQAATQVLSNPGRYALAFDAWLERNISAVAGEGLTSEQLAFIQNELYLRFIPDEVEESVRRVERCWSQYYCGGNYYLTAGERARAIEAVNNIEELVRRQRWDKLLKN